MDVQMPEMDGIEATAALRAREHGTGNRQPVIAMTALVMQGDRERCLAAGMDGYLTKPIRPRALDEVLDQYVAQKRENGAVHGHTGTAHEKAGTAHEHAAKTPAETSRTLKQESINAQELLERVGGDREFLTELVSLFREDGPRQLNRIRKALENNDLEDALRTAHSLRGTLANLAAQAAADLAAEIEHASKAEDLTRANAAFLNLDLELPHVIDALSAICEGVTP
jgi:DNA-binding response OmpR family regulator